MWLRNLNTIGGRFDKRKGSCDLATRDCDLAGPIRDALLADSAQIFNGHTSDA